MRRKRGVGTDDRWLAGLDAVPLPTLVLDARSRVLAANRAASDLMGDAVVSDPPTSTRELLGRDLVPAPGGTAPLVLVDTPGGSSVRARALVASIDPSDASGPGIAGGVAVAALVVEPAHDTDPAEGSPRIEPWIEVAGRARRLGDRATCVVIGILGLDRINLAYSRSTGDAVLGEITRRLSATLPGHGVVARVAGDRIAVVTDDQRDGLAARLVEVVRRPVETPLGRVAIGCSAGVASGDPRSCLLLLDRADRHLVGALRIGAGVVVDRGDTDDGEPDVAVVRLAGDLVDAVRDRELTAHFQPVVDLNRGTVVELEALARWRQADGTRLPAAEFLTAAELTGTIVAMGRDVLEQSLDLLEELRGDPRLGDRAREVRMSVNVSVRELLDPSFTTMLHEVLDARDHDHHHRLQLELGGPIPDLALDAVRRRVDQIRAAGIRVVLDGVGGSSSDLAVLRDVAVDGVKLAPSLIDEVGLDACGERFLRAILGLARDLGVDVTVKGVERPEQHRFLRRLGCRFAQGHLYGRPMPVDEVTTAVAMARRAVPPPERIAAQRHLEALLSVGAFDHTRLDGPIARLALVTGADLAYVVVDEHDASWIAARHDPNGCLDDPPGAALATGLASRDGVGLGRGGVVTAPLVAPGGDAIGSVVVVDLDRTVDLVDLVDQIDQGIADHPGVPDGALATTEPDHVRHELVGAWARDLMERNEWLLELRGRPQPEVAVPLERASATVTPWSPNDVPGRGTTRDAGRGAEASRGGRSADYVAAP